MYITTLESQIFFHFHVSKQELLQGEQCNDGHTQRQADWLGISPAFGRLQAHPLLVLQGTFVVFPATLSSPEFCGTDPIFGLHE